LTVECDSPRRWAAAFSDLATSTAATTTTSRSVARRGAEEDAVPTETPVAEDAEASPRVETAVAEPETSPARRTRRAKVDAGPEAEVAEGTAA
jgi:hypothetical protein